MRVDNNFFSFFISKTGTILLFGINCQDTGTHPKNRDKSRKIGMYGYPILRSYLFLLPRPLSPSFPLLLPPPPRPLIHPPSSSFSSSSSYSSSFFFLLLVVLFPLLVTVVIIVVLLWFLPFIVGAVYTSYLVTDVVRSLWFKTCWMIHRNCLGQSTLQRSLSLPCLFHSVFLFVLLYLFASICNVM